MHGIRGWPARGTRMAGGGGDVRRAVIRALPTGAEQNRMFRFLNPEVPVFEFFTSGCYTRAPPIADVLGVRGPCQ